MNRNYEGNNPMDGLRSGIWPSLARYRLRFPFDTRGRLLALCAMWFIQDNCGRSADRPEWFRRSVVTAKANSHPNSRATAQPTAGPAEPTRSNFTNSSSFDRDGVPSPSTVGAATTSTELLRFPDKSTNLRGVGGAEFVEVAVDTADAPTPIDLPSALQLAGWNSLEVLLAQQRVLAVAARQQLAAAQALPNLNLGTNYDSHTGALQRASGLILQVQRSALYVGAGGNAVAAGTVNMPGLQYNLNVGETYFGYLASRQRAEQSRAAAAATQNHVLLQLAIAYCQLVRAQGTRAIAVKVREDAAEVARVTADFAKIGQGRPADAERAATELARRIADIFAADAAIMEASSRLGQILNLESSVRLQSSESWVVPRPIVPDPIPLPELIAISLYQRPEVAERRAEVHAAMLELDSARLLLFSPQFIAGFSDGAFGGGSNVNAAGTGDSRFGSFGNRTDADIVLYWSIRNLGLANRALVKTATARLAATGWEQTQRLNEVRAEVADAYARTQTCAAQLDVRQRAVASSERGFRADLQRAHAGEGRPIEVLDSLRLVARTQQDYLDTITNYNQAHYELYVAIGQPPAGLLIHSADPTIPATNVEEPR